MHLSIKNGEHNKNFSLSLKNTKNHVRRLAIYNLCRCVSVRSLYVFVCVCVLVLVRLTDMARNECQCVGKHMTVKPIQMENIQNCMHTILLSHLLCCNEMYRI